MIPLTVVTGLSVLALFSLCVWQTVDRQRERQEVRAERADLLQRIQAPQYAAVKHYNQDVKFEAPPAINPDLDEDYWVSKEDLAEQMAREEVNGGN